jgi:aldehyde dehydrogenase (NAD+)
MLPTLNEALERLGVGPQPEAIAVGSRCTAGLGEQLVVRSPIDGSALAEFALATPAQAEPLVAAAGEAFQTWRTVPAPQRGELVRQLGEQLRAHKENLAAVISWEAGKIAQESLGEVQEMIDICEFAVGLSRQLYGRTIASERPLHRLAEQWHPLGPIGVITAFNFPMAVWAWNAALALVCGDSVIWKPSEKTPLCALATLEIFDKALAKFGEAPKGLLQVVVGERDTGEILADSRDVAIVSATGSTRMGHGVGVKVAQRLGRTILELGGNNAMIVAPSADLEMALRAIVFSAVGTAGQRCTSLRRLIVHEDVYDRLVARLVSAYEGLPTGDPLADGVLVGPLIDAHAFEGMEGALEQARSDGGKVHGGGRAIAEEFPHAYYSNPAIVEMPTQTDIVCQETFAPILYVMKYREFPQAVELHNAVPQGLSSCIFSTDVREAEEFMSAVGSDCGIANVNIGPSGAEIGGAFGGEKDTGGGRESGSDAWKGYMRRQTNTVNYSRELPLAQGIKFEI